MHASSEGKAAASVGEEKSAEGEIVYDSSTLRMSVKDKIKRLSQVKFEPPSSASQAQKKATSLPRDTKLTDSISGWFDCVVCVCVSVWFSLVVVRLVQPCTNL